MSLTTRLRWLRVRIFIRMLETRLARRACVDVGCPPMVDVATAGDREALLALLRAQLDEHAIFLEGDELAQAVDGVLADGSRGLFLLARREGRAVGVAYLGFTWTIEHGGRSA